MILAKRSGTSPTGHEYHETINRITDNAFTVSVRSTDPEDNFDVTLSLRELFAYMAEAISPFERTVIEGAAGR